MMSLRFFCGSVMTFTSLRGSPSTTRRSGRNGSQIAALHEQLGVDAGGGANDIGRIVELDSHFKFSELRLLRLGTPQVGPEGDRYLVALRPSVDLLALRDSRPQIVNDSFRQPRFGRGFDSLNERYESRVEVGSLPGHHRDRFFADEIGMFDGAYASKQTSPNSLVGVDVRHDVGAAAFRLFHNRAQFF